MMKKIIVAEEIRPLLEENKTYLHRSDVRLFNAATNDEVLAIHNAEKANLIITLLHIPGLECESLFSKIRRTPDLRAVSLLLICKDNQGDKERALQCNPNAVLHQPLEAEQLLTKIRELLDVPWRGAYRVLVSVKIVGQARDNAFFCKLENISTSGMQIETERPLDKGDRLDCSFFLPESRQLVSQCEVVRVLKQPEQSNQHRFGIKFLSLDPKVRTAIETFVEKKYQQANFKPLPPRKISG